MEHPAAMPDQPPAPPSELVPGDDDQESILISEQEEIELFREGPVRRITKDQYEELVKQRISIFCSGLLTFHEPLDHMDHVDICWTTLKCYIPMLAARPRAVDWETLDPETQEMLTAWAPKAKGYLETRGADGKSIHSSTCFSVARRLTLQPRSSHL